MNKGSKYTVTNNVLSEQSHLDHRKVLGGGSSKNKDKNTSSHVYVKSKEHEWVPAMLVESDGKKYATVDVPKYKSEEEMLSHATKKKQSVKIKLKDYDNNVLPLQNVDDAGKLREYEDMVNLPYLHEAAILYNLKLRHSKEKPYTRTGDVLVAMNPYKWYAELYTEKKRNAYAQRLVWERSENDPRSTIEPHVYEVSALSYKGLAVNNANQSILVSGESGAGKTETVKICMNHIASVQRGPSRSHQAEDKDASGIVQKVLDSNPLLEAFGNAKTRRNDNSSRFGKFLQLQFDQNSRSVASLAGSKCEVYLLEKNRVTGHVSEERTFHIFYQLLAANEKDKTRIWKGLANTSNESFSYVGPSRTNTIEGISDGDRFGLTRDTLELIGVKGDSFTQMMQAMCIVLQLGNITFRTDGGDEDKSVILSNTELKNLAELMGIEKPDLTKCLTERTMKTRNEVYAVPLNPETAKDSCDAFSKEIYGRLFLWLVRVINKATCAEDNYKAGKTMNYGTIGLLDIFGFESFDINRFEQLCINYANEKIQHKFTEDIFRSVQEEYESEGIPLQEITYDDNTDVVNLIEGRGGLLSILNDECLRPKGNATAFVSKAISQIKKSPCLLENKMDRLGFGIHHFAGKVMYYAEDFVTRNLDTLPSDLLACGTKCSNNPIVVSLFKEEPPTAKKGSAKRSKSAIAGDTVWTKYKCQLSELMKNIRKTETRYIRCIKPNTIKKPTITEHVATTEQLRSAGLVAGVKIARSAFPNRLDNNIVYLRYNGMWDRKNYPSKGSSSNKSDKLKADCSAMLTGLLKSKEVLENNQAIKQFVVGKTRTYFRSGALEFLESNRQKGLDAQAITVQRIVRGWLVRKRGADSKKKRDLERQKKLQEKKERQEKLAREAKERELKRQKDRKEFKDRIENLKKQISQVDHDAEEEIRSLDRRQENAKKLLKEYKSKIEDVGEGLNKDKRTIENKKAVIEANKSEMHILKKENKDIAKQHSRMSKKFKRFSANTAKLRQSNDDGCSTFSELSPDASRLMAEYDDLQEEADGYTHKNRELNQELGIWQNQYWEKASQRLEVQKALRRILTLIQKDCDNKKLLQKTNTIITKLEKKTNLTMVELDEEYGGSAERTVDPTKDHFAGL